MATTELQIQCIYEFGGYHINEGERLLTRGTEVVSLPPKAIDLLLVLLRSGGRVLAKNELMESVWPDSFVEETNLTHNISLLRRVLGEARNGERFIETIPRRGYRFVARVERTFDDSVEILARERTITSIATEYELEIADAPPTRGKVAFSPAGSLRQKRTLAAAAVSLFAMALIFAGAYMWREREKKSSAVPFQQTSVRQLTTSGSIGNAALSPDGKLFAYSLEEKDGRRSLWLKHVDGSRELQLRPSAEIVHRGMGFAPDGSSLYFVESEDFSNGALYRMQVLGGAAEKIKDNVGYFQLAPDGKQLAFVRQSGNRSILVVADTSGTAEREIVWRPVEQGFIPTTPGWSADGELIAAGAISEENSENCEVIVVKVSDATVNPLKALNWKLIRGLRWLKGGDGLIMIGADEGSLWFSAQLWHISYPTGEARRITSDLATYGSVLSLSADGDSLLTVVSQPHSNIWLAPAANLSEAAQVTFDSVGRASGWNGLAWLSNGKIVYTTMPDKNVSLWTMETNGNKQEQLLSGGYTDRLPTVPSDGRFIIFESDRGGSGFDVWRMDPDGKGLRQLTFGAKTAQPHVSPDGRWVSFIGRHNEKWGLWRVSTEGGEPVFLNEKASISPRFSPDSTFIAVGYRDNGKGKLAVLSAASGEVIKLFNVPRLANLSASMKWVPGGQAVTYRDWADGIWKQSLMGGEPERLEGLPNEKLYGYDWSPDGKFFAFTRGAENRDVILIRDSSRPGGQLKILDQ